MQITRENTEIIRVAIGAKKIIISYATVVGDMVINGKSEFFINQKGMHPDFKKAFSNLNQYLARVLYISEEDAESVVVNQVDISGDESTLVRLTGKLALDSGNSVPIQSDNINMVAEECPYAFEKDVVKIDVGLLIWEAFEYCFEDKQAQLQLNLADADPINNDTLVPGENADEVAQKELF